ncbi:UNVERIFIED_CONTAM: hypothetical protein RKD50_000182 [Streptomyces canus]
MVEGPPTVSELGAAQFAVGETSRRTSLYVSAVPVPTSRAA